MEDEPEQGEGDPRETDPQGDDPGHDREGGAHDAPRQDTDHNTGVRRTRHDRYLGGVAGGFSRWLGVDPLFLRVGFAISTVWSAGTPLLYAALWLTIREEGAERSLLMSIRRPGGLRRAASVVALGIGATAVSADSGGVRLGLLLLAVGALLIMGQRGGIGREPVPAASPPGTSGGPRSDVSPGQALANLVTSPPEGTGRRRWALGGDGDERERRVPARLGWLFFWLVVLVGGATLALDQVGADIRPGVAVSVALLVVAVGLLVGAFRGRAHLLVPIGVLLTPLWVGFSLGSIPRYEGDGRVDYTPVDASQIEDRYTHGYGRMRLDLTQVDWADDQTREIDLGLTAGTIEVSVPRDVEVQLDADIGLGSGEVLHRWEGRFHQDLDSLQPDFWMGHGTMKLDSPARPSTCEEYYVEDESAFEHPLPPRDPVPEDEWEQWKAEPLNDLDEEQWERVWRDPDDRACRPRPAPDDPAVVKLDVQIGIGYVEVRHVETPV